jgi:glucose-6-phosphate dehydrogenase assembly protein OpcA
VEEAVSTSPVEQAVARIEAELGAFWSAPDDGTGNLKVRAATMNFAAVAASSELDKLREACDALTETHAGRAFLFHMDGRIAPWEAATDVHAECRIDGAVPICYDRIELAFGAMASGRAASILRSLALPEVPIVVEAGPGAPGILVDALAPIADRLIVDSAHTPVARIEELVRRSGGPVADRAFVRMFSWRELTARFFDHAPDALAGIRSVEIARTLGGKQEPAALFLGWLASRLGWVLSSRSSARSLGAASGAPDRSIAITLADDPRTDVEPGALTAVRISAEVGRERLECECVRTDTPGVVRWSMRGARSAVHEHRLGFRDEGWVLIKAIDAMTADRVYRDAVLAATEWSAL